MIFEGVTFVEKYVARMSKSTFIDKHVKVLWLDRGEQERRKMLSDVYDLIVPPKKDE